MTILPNTIVVPLPKNSLKNYLSKNKEPLLIGLSVGLFMGVSIATPVGALIYHLITKAAFASCPHLQKTNPSWLWETTPRE